mmetsp:Transcript_16651/g.52441  ORF Transcript_16651/g.52441 Transcript_16651/m.52441 type:complete len:214 (-) Transcript_16651:216-857(-)
MGPTAPSLRPVPAQRQPGRPGRSLPAPPRTPPRPEGRSSPCRRRRPRARHTGPPGSHGCVRPQPQRRRRPAAPGSERRGCLCRGGLWARRAARRWARTTWLRPARGVPAGRPRGSPASSVRLGRGQRFPDAPGAASRLTGASSGPQGRCAHRAAAPGGTPGSWPATAQLGVPGGLVAQGKGGGLGASGPGRGDPRPAAAPQPGRGGGGSCQRR